MLYKLLIPALFITSCGEGIKVALDLPEVPAQFQCRKIQASMLFFDNNPGCTMWAQKISGNQPIFFAECSGKKTYLISDNTPAAKIKNCLPHMYKYNNQEFKVSICGTTDKKIEDILKDLKYTEMCDFPLL
jgi:hypothetical protein